MTKAITVQADNLCKLFLSSMGIAFQVAVEKSKGSLSSAIELLRKYLDTYMTDKTAWEELGALYLQVYNTIYSLPTYPLRVVQG